MGRYESSRIQEKKQGKKANQTKLIFEYPIIHIVILVLASFWLARVLFADFDTHCGNVLKLIELLDPSVLDWSFVAREVFRLLVLALFMIGVVLIAIVLYKSCAKKIYIRNAHCIERLLSSNNSGEPACNREELAKRIYGDKRKNPNIPKKINVLIDESVSPIKKFLSEGGNDNILMINAKWGAERPLVY